MTNYKDQLQTLNNGAMTIRARANELGKRIREFEAWLNTIPGRAECELDLEDTTLRIQREGKTWKILCDNGTEFRPLEDVSLVLKLQAVKAFPDLLLAMLEGQNKLINKLNLAVDEFDNWFEGVKS